MSAFTTRAAEALSRRMAAKTPAAAPEAPQGPVARAVARFFPAHLLSFARLARFPKLGGTKAGRPPVAAPGRPKRAPAVAPPARPPRAVVLPDPDDELVGPDSDSAVNAARGRERSRCAAILNAAGPHTAAMAQVLAFRTRLSRAQAIEMIRAQPAPLTYAERGMRRNPNLGVGGMAVPAAHVLATSWDRAFRAAIPAHPPRDRDNPNL